MTPVNLIFNVLSDGAKLIISERSGANYKLKELLRRSSEIAGSLSTLIANPLATGCRVALEALDATPETPEEAALWQRRLEFAMEELERAFSNAQATSSKEAALYITILQGFCALRLAGGRALSATRLLAAADALEVRAKDSLEAAEMHERYRKRQRDQNAHLLRMMRLVQYRGIKPRNLISLEEDDAFEKAKQQVEDMRRLARTLRQLAGPSIT